MPIILTNPGRIDPLAITTMGVNVKESERAFGHFGTGIKYGISTLLRNGFQVLIRTDLEEMVFTTKTQAVRNVNFDLVCMNDQPIGFTTALGKNWKPWMALREFYCNAKDEGGDWTYGPLGACPAESTQVIISGPNDSDLYKTHSDWLLSPSLISSFSGLELHSKKNGSAYFYQGIKVGEFAKPSRFTYNITHKLDLTEDRTCDRYSYMTDLAWAFTQDCTDEKVLNTILLLPEQTVEADLPFYNTPSQAFIEAVQKLNNTHRGTLNQRARNLCRKHLTAASQPTIKLSSLHKAILEKALAFLEKAGEEIEEEIIVVESLGSHNIVGLADDGKIYLPKAVFDKGTTYVAATLYEEHLHISQSFPDCSRDMQDYLLQKVITLMQEVKGEVL